MLLELLGEEIDKSTKALTAKAAGADLAEVHLLGLPPGLFVCCLGILLRLEQGHLHDSVYDFLAHELDTPGLHIGRVDLGLAGL